MTGDDPFHQQQKQKSKRNGGDGSGLEHLKSTEEDNSSNEMNASEVNLSSEELIAVMESVKQGNMTVEQAWKEARNRSQSQKESSSTLDPRNQVYHRRTHSDIEQQQPQQQPIVSPTSPGSPPQSFFTSTSSNRSNHTQVQSSMPQSMTASTESMHTKENTSPSLSTSSSTTMLASSFSSASHPPPPSFPPPPSISTTPSKKKKTKPSPKPRKRSSVAPHSTSSTTQPFHSAPKSPIKLAQEAALSNEDQLQLLNSVKDGQISIEQALKLANSMAHEPAKSRSKSHSRSSSSSSIAAMNHMGSYMEGDMGSQAYFTDLALKRDLVLAGANIDLSESDLLRHQSMISNTDMMAFSPVASLLEDEAMDVQSVKHEQWENGPQHPSNNLQGDIKTAQPHMDSFEVKDIDLEEENIMEVVTHQKKSDGISPSKKITLENQKLAQQLSIVLDSWKTQHSDDALTANAPSKHRHKRTASISKRVTISLQSNRDEKRVLLLPDSMEEFFEMVEKSFAVKLTSICTKKGAEISDLDCLRDDDDLIACDQGTFHASCCRAASLTSLTSMSSNKIQRMHQLAPTSSKDAEPTDWIKLNVGGKIFRTTRETLVKEEGSMLALMFTTEHWNSATDEQGAFLFDRSPKYFEPLLSYLRDGTIILEQDISPRGVLAEAHFFGLWGAVEILQPLAEKEELQIGPNPPISRERFTSVLLSCSTTSTLRCQGLNFEGADLSCLDLRHINFKLANLVNCNLKNCNLEHCNFEQANLSNCVMDGSCLIGCNFSRARVDFASCKNCTFHDPSNRSHAVLEGSSWRGTDFEDSNLSCVNMCASSFKRAKLRHCNLRASNFAGADLAETDLSGCNLQDANLRGANTLHATFNKSQ